MALLAQGGCARLHVPRHAHVRPQRVLSPFATLSPAPGPGPGRVGSQNMEWVGATSSFFQQDSRPIMLFDGTYVRNIHICICGPKLLL